MKRLRAADVRRVVGAATHAITAVLDMRTKRIEPAMLNSAGSVSAEWYVETLWHYLAKQSLLDGVAGLDVEFRHPARLADAQLHFAVPMPEADEVEIAFHVLRRPPGGKRPERVPVALIKVRRNRWRRRLGVAPEPPYHPYGIEVRRRHLNSAKRVSWHTMVAMIMDVARRGAQFSELPVDRLDPTRLYIVPRFTFTPLGEAAAQDNLFIYPQFALAQPWIPGKTSATSLVTIWAAAHDVPWPIAESLVTVVRTSLVNGVRRPVDERGRVVRRADAPAE